MKTVYLDHCVVSNLPKDPARTWREVGLGKVLAKSCDDGQAEVYTSSTEIMEISLCAKFDAHGNVLDATDVEKGRLDLRMRCAKNVLEMVDAKRLLDGYEFVVFDEFLQRLEAIDPSIVRRLHFETFRTHHRTAYLGILGLLASHRRFGGAPALLAMQRAKLTSRLLHSRFAKEPTKFVDTLVDCARNMKSTSDDIWEEYDSKTITEIVEEIEENEKHTTPLDQKARKRLQKDKQLIADAYGMTELADTAAAVFGDLYYILDSFDYDRIKANWSALLGNPEAKLPEAFGPAGEPFAGAIEDRLMALENLFRSFTRRGLMISSLPTMIVLSELELCLTNGEIPTKGLTFDSQHAVMMTRANVFVTQDGAFANTSRRVAKNLNETLGCDITVATDAEELKNAIAKPEKAAGP